MLDIEIRRPRFSDIEELNRFFSIMVKDTFAKEGLADMDDSIANEIEDKRIRLNEDFESNGEERYFLTALLNGKIIGTIEYGSTSKLIFDCTNGELQGVVEIGSVFVLPDYQRQGIGTLLWNTMYLTLLGRNIEEFCFDSGYKNAQGIWKKKFGAPDYVVKDFWGEGYDHMIWRRSISKIKMVFRT